MVVFLGNLWVVFVNKIGRGNQCDWTKNFSAASCSQIVNGRELLAAQGANARDVLARLMRHRDDGHRRVPATAPPSRR